MTPVFPSDSIDGRQPGNLEIQALKTQVEGPIWNFSFPSSEFGAPRGRESTQLPCLRRETTPAHPALARPAWAGPMVQSTDAPSRSCWLTSHPFWGPSGADSSTFAHWRFRATCLHGAIGPGTARQVGLLSEEDVHPHSPSYYPKGNRASEKNRAATYGIHGNESS